MYGNYGGTNWLDMEAFAECFEAPVVPATISSVNVYFASVFTVTPNAEITVTLNKADENGMPGDVLASTSLLASQLVDASETYNDPTVFTFEQPVKVSGKFFITIGGFPNGYDSTGEDNIAMYSLLRAPGDRSTTYHLLMETDDYYEPTGEMKWYKQEDEACSFAIAPKLKFDNPLSGIENVDASAEDGPVTYYNMQGIRVKAENLTPGLYIRRQGSVSTKVKL